jgi:hypothetical protein
MLCDTSCYADEEIMMVMSNVVRSIPYAILIQHLPAKGFSTYSDSGSLGGEEFGIAESARR